jgi:hypothetical protein
MANILAANGFLQYGGTGSSPTYEQTVASIAAANATPIYYGDPVVQAAGVTGVGTGYIQQASPPQVLASPSCANGTLGTLVVTFTATTAPPVGSTLVLQGFSGGTAYGTVNGVYTILSSTTTTATVQNFAGVTIAAGTAGTAVVYTPVSGIFVGCRYLSVANKFPVWRNYWPGSDANGDVTAYVITDPNAQFIVQTGASSGTAAAVGLSNIGQNISFALGTGLAANGLSGAYADTYTLTANGAGSGTAANGPAANSFLPFRILSLANYNPGAISPLVSINGNDPTTPYNKIVVGFNNSMPRALAGI